MKGLLIKDLRLMKMQKNFFLVILLICICLMIFNNDISFSIGFLTFIISLFSISTISYDEFDNGNPFLFSLPISRNLYVKEKYVLSLILSISALILATAISIIINQLRVMMTITDLLMIAIMILPSVFLVLAIMLPLQLKFGSEKGRLAIVGILGGLILLGILVFKVLDILKINYEVILAMFSSLTPIALVVLEFIVALIILQISFIISLKIVNNKEF